MMRVQTDVRWRVNTPVSFSVDQNVPGFEILVVMISIAVAILWRTKNGYRKKSR